jgi:hypothetical protein
LSIDSYSSQACNVLNLPIFLGPWTEFHHIQLEKAQWNLAVIENQLEKSNAFICVKNELTAIASDSDGCWASLRIVPGMGNSISEVSSSLSITYEGSSI